MFFFPGHTKTCPRNRPRFLPCSGQHLERSTLGPSCITDSRFYKAAVLPGSLQKSREVEDSCTAQSIQLHPHPRTPASAAASSAHAPSTQDQHTHLQVRGCGPHISTQASDFSGASSWRQEATVVLVTAQVHLIMQGTHSWDKALSVPKCPAGPHSTWPAPPAMTPPSLYLGLGLGL